MRLLLDTHIFLWAITGDARLSKESRRLFEASGSDLVMSVASVWEVVIKVQLGKLSLPRPVVGYLRKQMEVNRVGALAITVEHVSRLEVLPVLHRDPFDRMIVVQAIAEGRVLVSQDAQVRQYEVVCRG